MLRQHLYERTRELDRAHQALMAAESAGCGRVLVVTGEPGIGKSALLDAVRRDAHERGFGIGFGKADEVNQIAPGAPVLLALRSGPAPLLDEAGFRSLAPLYDKPLWLVDQIAELLEVRVRQGPVLLLLDDLQWADQLSRFALRALVSRLIGSPVVWMLAARTSPPFFLTLSDSAAMLEGVELEHLALAPLSEAGVMSLSGDLLGRTPAGHPVATLTAAGGNPFLVVQLCQGLNRDRAAGWGSPAIPLSLATALQTRLSSLGDDTIELVEVAAVWGVPLPFSVARRLLAGSVAHLLREAEPAAAAGLITITTDGIEFRHDLLRQFVYDELDEERRTALHVTMTTYLLETDGGAAAAVGHARIAAAHGSPTGVDVLRRAARECQVATPSTAAALMQEAFHAARPGGPEWREIGEECAEFLSRAQRGTDVAAVVDALLAHPHSAEFEARLQVLAARAMWLVGNFDDMAQRTRLALVHSGMSKPLRSRLLATRALALSRVGPMGTAIEAAEDALNAGRALGDQPTTALALQALGEIAKNEGRHLAAYALFHELRNIAGPAHLPEEVAALQFIDRFDEAEVLLVAAERRLEEADSTHLPSLACARLWQEFKQAHFDSAAVAAQTLLRIGDEFGTHVYRVDAHVVLSVIASVRGDLDHAEALIDRAEHEAAAHDTVQLPGLMLGRARIAAARGDVTTGVAILRTLVTSPDDAAHTYWPRMLDQLRLYAGLAVAAGQLALAEEAAELAAAAAQINPGVESLEGIARQVRGFVSGDPEMLESAVGYLRMAPRPMLLASALTDHGSALARSGGKGLGVAQLEEALDIYVRLEANPAAADVRRALAAVGAHAPQLPRSARPRFGWGSLTESELKVAELVSAGHTNRTVARSLGVSTNTVGTHLRSIFSKLDVQSRVQLTNVVRDHRPR